MLVSYTSVLFSQYYSPEHLKQVLYLSNHCCLYMTLCLKGDYIEAAGGRGESKRDHNCPNLALLGAIREIICKADFL